MFPPMVVQMVAVGEQTGALETMLNKIADFYEDEVDEATANLLALLEPVMICFLGVVIGGIVISMYMPMFDLISKIALTGRRARCGRAPAPRDGWGTMGGADAVRVEIERQLRWLMTLRGRRRSRRCLISAFAIELLFRPGETLRPLFLLTAVAYGMVLLYAVAGPLAARLAVVRRRCSSSATRSSSRCSCASPAASTARCRSSTCCRSSVAALLLYRRGGWPGRGACGCTPACPASARAWSLPARGRTRLGAPSRGAIAYYLRWRTSWRSLAVGAAVVLPVRAPARAGPRAGRAPRGGGAAAGAQREHHRIDQQRPDHDRPRRADPLHESRRRGDPRTRAARRRGPALEASCSGSSRVVPAARSGGACSPSGASASSAGSRPADGRRIFLGIAVSNLHDKAGQPLGYIFIFQDLTEIHALEQEVRLKERMAALGEMAAGMAHELRNPLGVDQRRGAVPEGRARAAAARRSS